MRTERSFHPARIYLLARNVIVLNYKSIAVVAAATAGVLVFISLLDAIDSLHPRLHQNLYLLVLFMGGLILTSRSFKDLHDPVRGISWLLLPASMLEKIVARILLTTFVYVAGTMLIYSAFSIVSEGLNMLLFGRHHPLFFPFEPLVLRGALTYVAIQAPFLVGAVYFRKHALSKTVLSLLGFSILFALGTLIAVKIIFGDQLAGLDFDVIFTKDQLSESWMQLERVGRTAAGTAKAIFWVIVPIVCWTICYFRLRETER